MRKHYIDNIRWITVCIVVIYHVIYIYNSVQPFGVVGAFKEVQYQDGFLYFVYPWFMALLFVISGMSSRLYLENNSEREFVKSRTRKLLIPSTVALFVFWWVQGYYNMVIGGAFDTMMLPDVIPSGVRTVITYIIMSISGIGPLWYIQVLWIFSVILAGVRKIEKDRLYILGGRAGIVSLLICTVFAYLFAQILNTPIITVYRFGIYGFCFFMGYFVFSHDEVIDRLEKKNIRVMLTTVALALGIFYVIIYFGENYAIEPVVNNILACVYCWIAILAILAIGKKYLDFENGFTKWISSKSWGLYLFHYLPLSMMAFYLRKYFENIPAFFCYLLTLMAAFSGAIILYEIVSRIPVLRYVVIGIKREKTVM